MVNFIQNNIGGVRNIHTNKTDVFNYGSYYCKIFVHVRDSKIGKGERIFYE